MLILCSHIKCIQDVHALTGIAANITVFEKCVGNCIMCESDRKVQLSLHYGQ